MSGGSGRDKKICDLMQTEVAGVLNQTNDCSRQKQETRQKCHSKSRCTTIDQSENFLTQIRALGVLRMLRT